MGAQPPWHETRATECDVPAAWASQFGEDSLGLPETQSAI